MSSNTIKLVLAIWKRVQFYSYKSKDRYIISIPTLMMTRGTSSRGIVVSSTRPPPIAPVVLSPPRLAPGGGGIPPAADGTPPLL
jgi:hypothetical protein